MRKWFINGRFLAQPLTGVQRCAHEVVRALDRLIAEGHPWTRDVSLEILAPPGAGPPLLSTAIPVRIVGRGGGHVWEQAYLGRIDGGLLSLCNTGPLLNRKQIVCIHDVNTRLVPQSYAPAFRLLYRTLIPALGRTAARVATVSRFSAAMLAEHAIADRAKIRVIANGADHAAGWPAAASSRIVAAAGPRTVVALGSNAPHKNLKLLIGLADRMAETGLKLVIAGGADPRVFAASGSAADARNVTWLGKVSDGELAALFDTSLCLAFPSLTEGFGLPPLEAMMRGCAVVASDRGSLPEVLGDAALIVAADDDEAWLGSFALLQRDPGARRALTAKGTRRARQYTWRKAAEGYLALMRECDGFDVARPAERCAAANE